eukprot:scaffold89256_cov22-Tisochrysis_lutea.AAC.1
MACIPYANILRLLTASVPKKASATTRQGIKQSKRRGCRHRRPAGHTCHTPPHCRHPKYTDPGYMEKLTQVTYGSGVHEEADPGFKDPGYMEKLTQGFKDPGYMEKLTQGFKDTGYMEKLTQGTQIRGTQKDQPHQLAPALDLFILTQQCRLVKGEFPFFQKLLKVKCSKQQCIADLTPLEC